LINHQFINFHNSSLANRAVNDPATRCKPRALLSASPWLFFCRKFSSPKQGRRSFHLVAGGFSLRSASRASPINPNPGQNISSLKPGRQFKSPNLLEWFYNEILIANRAVNDPATRWRPRTLLSASPRLFFCRKFSSPKQGRRSFHLVAGGFSLRSPVGVPDQSKIPVKNISSLKPGRQFKSPNLLEWFYYNDAFLDFRYKPLLDPRRFYSR
jgi:hypothetical protein